MSLKEISKAELSSKTGSFVFYSLPKLAQELKFELTKIPYSIRVLIESALRNFDDYLVKEDDILRIAKYNPKNIPKVEFPFMPGRVILQDFTGVPCVVDLAALRSAMVRMKGDPSKINPSVRVDLVIDHSVQVDYFGSDEAFQKNMELEFKRNIERYEFLKWGQSAFQNFGVIPPGVGIVHQVNLEYLATVVLTKNNEVYPDSLVGTDSHTTMINGLGVLGWGVGGIEAEAVMLGQPLYMLIPEVIGVKLYGKLKEGTTATDLVLTVTEILRKKGVVEKFVEFFGPGLEELTLPDRATIANMAPEYGATIGFFPVDEETLNYLRKTGRNEELVDLVERYYKEQGMFRTKDSPEPEFTDIVELDLSSVEPSLAGPKRPQDRVALKEIKHKWNSLLTTSIKQGGYELPQSQLQSTGIIQNGYKAELRHGDIVIAAITSCTNTSNPSVLVGAGILAKKAVEKGLKAKPYVKTSLAPGSRVVTEYLESAGLMGYLKQLGFHVVGYGCTTCIGNSGPLPDEVVKAINEGNLIVSAVLSGNRNFEGRISPHVKANFLASPMLVVAYAIAGTVNIDLYNEPLGTDQKGNPVYLKDIWPSLQEIQEIIDNHIKPEVFKKKYENVRMINEMWNQIKVPTGLLYEWNENSTYIQEPPFFQNMTMEIPPLQEIRNARCLVKVGDSITTDHISPAGSISKSSPAGQYLISKGVQPEDFNSYGARRGNDRVMTRGTFANIRLRNQLVDREGGYTIYFPTNEVMTIYDASELYKKNNIPLIVLAGKEYGTGSSRDWAAKGTYLLGIKAVIAQSFERIHRSNLVGMGVLPLQFLDGESHETLGLTGKEVYHILGIDDNIKPNQILTVRADEKEFKVICRLDNQVEIDYYKNGGILQTVLRKFLQQN
ncbi:MAG: aconitate hydratase AcnA [Leptospiraceae bacterium]|nr:aconitate hydratase AcnA [Leptospiraceae bacterium]MDW7976458.1 aconitate hydratase AcnA [Leptospiraceae bacterium]